jgi:hypothetical protein
MNNTWGEYYFFVLGRVLVWVNIGEDVDEIGVGYWVLDWG